MKSERDFRNYLAGAALAFGIVLLTSQVLQILYGGASEEDITAAYDLIVQIYLAAHVVGGFAGGYLVARVRRSDFIQTGTVTAILAYMFEVVYNFIVEGSTTDIYAAISLLIGGIVGAMFLRAKTERARIMAKKPEDKPNPETTKQE